MTRDEICKALDEISNYFYGCYRNAGGGTRACEQFHNWMCAVDAAKELVMKDGETTMNKDYGIICLCAMRYALGRQTYMPGLVQDYIKSNISDIETSDITTMIRDINEADNITEHKMSDGSVLKLDGLGDTNIDRPGWERFQAFLMSELEKRRGA